MISQDIQACLILGIPILLLLTVYIAITYKKASEEGKEEMKKLVPEGIKETFHAFKALIILTGILLMIPLCIYAIWTLPIVLLIGAFAWGVIG